MGLVESLLFGFFGTSELSDGFSGLNPCLTLQLFISVEKWHIDLTGIAFVSVLGLEILIDNFLHVI